MVGDSSHLFEPEDFQKVEVKPLRNVNQELVKNEKQESTIKSESSDYNHLIFDENHKIKNSESECSIINDTVDKSTIKNDKTKTTTTIRL
jgi:hypothetical protein